MHQVVDIKLTLICHEGDLKSRFYDCYYFNCFRVLSHYYLFHVKKKFSFSLDNDDDFVVNALCLFFLLYLLIYLFCHHPPVFHLCLCSARPSPTGPECPSSCLRGCEASRVTLPSIYPPATPCILLIKLLQLKTVSLNETKRTKTTTKRIGKLKGINVYSLACCLLMMCRRCVEGTQIDISQWLSNYL